MITETLFEIPDIEPLPEVRMWRCRQCGKFSHAKRRPPRHQRWVRDSNRPVLDESGSIAGWDGDFVNCGPFDEYLAVPRD